MNRTRNMILCAMFTVLVAVGAFIKVPVPFVPFTLQFLFTTLAGIFLGARLGAMSVALYVVLGLLGLPVFASGGGIGYIFQPTFGYLIGFIIGTYVTGMIVQKEENPSRKRILVACLLGLGIIYICGTAYYWIIMTFYLKTDMGIWALFLYCVFLSAPGDIILCCLTATFGKRLIPIIRRELEVAK